MGMTPTPMAMFLIMIASAIRGRIALDFSQNDEGVEGTLKPTRANFIGTGWK